jgi:hypothetical protein
MGISRDTRRRSRSASSNFCSFSKNSVLLMLHLRSKPPTSRQRDDRNARTRLKTSCSADGLLIKTTFVHSHCIVLFPKNGISQVKVCLELSTSSPQRRRDSPISRDGLITKSGEISHVSPFAIRYGSEAAQKHGDPNEERLHNRYVSLL